MSASDIKALVRVIALSIANNEDAAEDIVKWAYKDAEKVKPVKREKKKDGCLDLPFTSDRFANVWAKLLTQPKWKNKTHDALQLSLDKLSKYDEAFAIQLIEDAIERNWQGVVFGDTDEKYRQWKQGGQHKPATDKNEVNALWGR